MKQLQTRLVFIIFSIFFTGWLICGLSIWSLEFNKAKRDILRTAGILLDTAAAVRDYTSNQVQPQFDLIEAGLKVPVADQAVQGGNNQAQGYQPTEEKEVPEFNRVTVPSYAAQQVLNQLEKNKIGYSYRETAINPTNRKDLAAPWELEIINYFAANPKAPPKMGERFDTLTKQKTYYIAKPIQITKESCLVCHSTPERAPASLIKTYGSENGFGWKLNEVVGARVISVPSIVQYNEARRSIGSYLLAIASIFLVAYTAVIVIIYRSVTKPLDFITHLLEEVSLHQTEGAQLPEDKSNPLNNLNRSINRLLISLNKALKSPQQ
jgi:methyl-accepting chemotaxis protein